MYDNKSLYLPITDESIDIVEVRFLDHKWETDSDGLSGRAYPYKTHAPLAVDDYVVVQSRNTFAVARVTKINVPISPESEWTYRWVVGKIDFQPFDEVLRREEKIIEKIDGLRVAHARKQMREALGISDDILIENGGV